MEGRFGDSSLIRPVAWPCPDIWADVARLIESSVARTDDETLLDVVDALNIGRAQLWVIGNIDAALVTLAVNTKDGPALEYWHLGGSNARAWFSDMTAQVEAAARQAGFVKMVAGGRMGWARLAKDYRPVAIKLEKRL